MKNEKEVIKSLINLAFAVNVNQNTRAIFQNYQENNTLPLLVKYLDTEFFRDELIEWILLADTYSCKALFMRMLHAKDSKDFRFNKSLLAFVTSPAFAKAWQEKFKTLHDDWYVFLSSELLTTDKLRSKFFELLILHPDVVEESFMSRLFWNDAQEPTNNRFGVFALNSILEIITGSHELLTNEDMIAENLHELFWYEFDRFANEGHYLDFLKLLKKESSMLAFLEIFNTPELRDNLKIESIARASLKYVYDFIYNHEDGYAHFSNIVEKINKHLPEEFQINLHSTFPFYNPNQLEIFSESSQ